jgi:tRNA threonylcarbamoyladenosine biosynthesis protein TsaE
MWIEGWAHQLPAECVVLFQGNLGSGKTQMVKDLVEILGGKHAASPTFALHHSYPAPLSRAKVIEHFDLYRLQNEEELDSIAFWDYFTADFGIIAVEWPEKVKPQHLPLNWPLYWIDISAPAPDNELRHLRFRMYE